MLLDNTVLFKRLLALGKSGSKPVHFKWGAELLIDSEVIPITKVSIFERNSDFIHTYSDINFIQLMMPTTTYVNAVLPNKRNLKLRLFKEQTTRTGDTVKVTEVFTQTFDAHLVNSDSPSIKARTGRTNTDGLDDLNQLAEVEFQLTDEELTELRLIDTAGIYRNVRTDNLLRALLSYPVSGRKGKRIGVDLVKGDNERIYYQLMIPNGIKLIDLPEYLQSTYGIYASKVGYYLSRGYWYIYPLLDYTRFDKTTNNLTILKVPRDEMLGNDNSYLLEGDNLFVFATGDTRHSDKSEHKLNNVGNGIRYAQASNLIDNFRQHSKGVSNIPPGRNFREGLVEERPTGLNRYKTADGLLTDNPWKEISELSSGLSSTIGITWEHSNPELLYPGMPVKFLYKLGNEVVRLYGTLVGVDSITTTRQRSQTDMRYVTSSALTIHVEREHDRYVKN